MKYKNYLHISPEIQQHPDRLSYHVSVIFPRATLLMSPFKIKYGPRAKFLAETLYTGELFERRSNWEI